VDREKMGFRGVVFDGSLRRWVVGIPLPKFVGAGLVTFLKIFLKSFLEIIFGVGKFFEKIL
jgi:hypothetical protein